MTKAERIIKYLVDGQGCIEVKCCGSRRKFEHSERQNVYYFIAQNGDVRIGSKNVKNTIDITDQIEKLAERLGY